jgi:two-component system response regulator ResD
VLENEGYTVFSAENADEGFDMFKITEPDLLCLDIMMPQELGLTLYEKIRKNPSYANTPVIIISGVVSEEDFEFRKLVPDESIPPPQEYIEKPINRAQFVKTVERLIKQSPQKTK